jgi:hypothetical protein
VGVVEHEHERVGRRQSFEQLAHRTGGAIALVRKHGSAGRGESRQRRKDRAELGTNVIVERVEATRVKALEVLVERIDEYPEGQVALELRPGSGEYEVPAPVRTSGKLCEEPGLADPGFAPHLERGRLTVAELGESVIDREELLGPANEVLRKQGHVRRGEDRPGQLDREIRVPP